MAKKAKGAGTPATAALDRAGITYSVHTYEHDPSAPGYGLEAARALGLPPERVFKTLLADTDGGPRPETLVAIVPVTGSLDLKALAATVGAKKATMADPAAAERLTGYVVGGISPIGQKRPLRAVLDESALDHPTVYVSGGRRGLDLGIAPADLVTMLDATTARIRRDA
jgi:Cys-tRNA(Pro)/Cys-tRNA(Cys) deacylase